MEKEVDLLLESEEEQFTFQEFYLHAGPVGTRSAEGGAGRAQAARQRVQCVAGEANRMDDDDQSVDMDKLVFRPNPERLGLELSHSDDEE